MRSVVCKLTGCERKRFQLRTLCLFHIRERERARKTEREEKKKLRKHSSKKYQTSQRKKLIKKLDAVFSKIIRIPGKCLRCGFGPPDRSLQASHIWTRHNMSVRWDLENAKPLCGGCHIWWHAHPAEAWEWLATKRTAEELTQLRLRAQSIKQWTDDELKALLADLTAKLSTLQ